MNDHSTTKHPSISCTLGKSELPTEGRGWEYYVSRNGVRMRVVERFVGPWLQINNVVEIVDFKAHDGCTA